MKIIDCINKENGNGTGRLYRNGKELFWHAFEQSAMALCLLKGLIPVKKPLSGLKDGYITAGFPNERIDKFLDEICVVHRDEGYIEFTYMSSITDDFNIWKSGVQKKEKKTKVSVENNSHPFVGNKTEISLCSMILSFEPIKATPMECMDFILKLKEIANGR